MTELHRGQDILAYYAGHWRNATYNHPGEKAGEHWVVLDEAVSGRTDVKIIKNEIQRFLL